MVFKVEVAHNQRDRIMMIFLSEELDSFKYLMGSSRSGGSRRHEVHSNDVEKLGSGDFL